MKKILCHIDMSISDKSIKDRVKEVWGEYMAYHIYNVSQINYETEYEQLAETLGNIRLCHAVNDKTTEFSKSRDIKYDPDIYHYFASNTRQPLHTDYAYYKEEECPGWLMLYCVYPSEYGGMTNMLSTKTLVDILQKYNPDLLDAIHRKVQWEYTGDDGDKIHEKPLFDGEKINWNYWQIKEELNTSETMKIREDFFRFLEDVIVDGSMYDFSKIWKTGDCIIWSDKHLLHGRDAFLGDRWLKDHAFYEKNNKDESNISK